MNQKVANHNLKKRVAEDDMDRISALPEKVSELILARMPVLDAVRTSILSKKWRYIWCGIPELVFDDTICPNGRFEEKEITKKIFQVLLFHKGPILEFKLSIRKLKICVEMDQLMLLLSRSGLEKLVFRIWTENAFYKLPSSFFSCQCLKHLFLYYCEVKIPLDFKGFNRLITLHLDQVRIDAESLNIFIASCPLVSRSTLIIPNGFDKLEVSAPKLKYLSLKATVGSLRLNDVPLLSSLSLASYYTRTISYDSYYDSDSDSDSDSEYEGIVERKRMNSIEPFTLLPDIHNLHIGYDFLQSLCAGSVPTLMHLTVIQLTDICFSKLNEVSCIIHLHRKAPNLQKLSIKMIGLRGDPKPVMEYLNAHGSHVTLDQLCQVNINLYCGTVPELEFIRLVLANSPMLKVMRIEIRAKAAGLRLNTVMKLIKFPRASAKAELICQ